MPSATLAAASERRRAATRATVARDATAAAPATLASHSQRLSSPTPAHCIAVYTTPPAQPHQELGTIAIVYGNTGFLEKPEDLMKTIRPEVCKAGGDAAVGIANSYGTYLKATVLSLTPAAPAKDLTTPEDASGSDTKALEGPVEL